MKTIIAFCGPIGAGKTTLARELVVRDNFHLINFAEPIRRMLTALISYQGITQQEAWLYLTERKAETCLYLNNRLPRWALQSLGTEWGRNLIGTDLWVDAWERKINHTNHDLIVVDDLRFPNEAERIRKLNGQIYGVNRLGYIFYQTHASEDQIGLFSPDYWLENSGTPEDLYHQLKGVIR